MKKLFLITLVIVISIGAFVQSSPTDRYRGWAEIFQLESLSANRVDDHFFYEKFGWNNSIDISDGQEEIWDGSSIYEFSQANPIEYLSSDNALDNEEITIEGLDAVTWKTITQRINLDGQTKKALYYPLARINRAYNSDSSDLVGQVYIYEDAVVVGGVPVSGLRAQISLDDHGDSSNQTEMAIYTVPSDEYAYISSVYYGINGIVNSNAIITIWIRECNHSFRLLKRFSTSSAGTGMFQYNFRTPVRLNPKTDIAMRIEEVSSNGTSIAGGFSITTEKTKYVPGGCPEGPVTIPSNSPV